jgi:hypothetical protein
MNRITAPTGLAMSAVSTPIAARSVPRLLLLLALAGLLSGGVAGVRTSPSRAATALGKLHPRRPSPNASAARTLSLHETAHLHLVSHQGTQILNEEGTSSGTLVGPLAVKITIYYTQVTITFTARPKGGTLSGRGEGSYYVEGHIGHFSGTTAIVKGTGTYAHASGSLHVTGVILRKHYELLYQANGQLRI